MSKKLESKTPSDAANCSAISDTDRLDFFEAHFRLPFEIRDGEHDGLEGTAWAICPNSHATLRETIDAAIHSRNSPDHPRPSVGCIEGSTNETP
jgi:hypothetical protein